MTLGSKQKACAARTRRWILLAVLAAATGTARAEQSEAYPPERALELFQTDPGVKVELVAAEPLVESPVALAFDETGAMFVVENRGYPEGPGEGKPPAGRIARLEDKDGDGFFETRGDYADGFDFPNGILPWDGGVFVTCAPYLYFLKDADGDGKAETREIVLEGFSLGGSTQLRVSHPTLGMDGWIYLSAGLSGGEVRHRKTGQTAVLTGGRDDLRFHPVRGAVQSVPGPAQYGLSFDDWGNRFVCSNREHIMHIAGDPWGNGYPRSETAGALAESIPDHGGAARIYALTKARTTAFAHAGTFTAACGLAIYRGTALPEKYYGGAFVCEPTANLIHFDKIEPKGSTFVARRIHENSEFLLTTDEWFRPVFLANGPDGALYVCDMQRRTIEHPTYLPAQIRANTDFQSGRDRGRIYRITGIGGAKVPLPKLADASPAELCKALKDERGWVRDSAYRLILQMDRQSRPYAELERLAQGQGAARTRAAAIRLAVMGGHSHSASLFQTLLADPDSRVREQAILAGCEWQSPLTHNESAMASLAAQALDPDPRVRYGVAATLTNAHNIRGAYVDAALLSIALKDDGDPWISKAILDRVRLDPGFAKRYFKAISWEAAEERVEFACSIAREAAYHADAITRELLLSDPPVTEEVQIAAVLGTLQAREASTAPGRERRWEKLFSKESRSFLAVSDAIARFEDSTSRIAGDRSRTPILRVYAVECLSRLAEEPPVDVLGPLLSPEEPAELRRAAARGLVRLDGRVGAEVVAQRETWRSLTPDVRTAAVEAMLARPETIGVFMEGLEKGDIQPWTLDPARRAQLLKHPDASVRERAAAIFNTAEAGDRAAVYEEYRTIFELQADRAGGREVFRKNCAQCHIFDREGAALGPDLTGIGSQSEESILMHVLNPNVELLPGYESFLVETKSGESRSGIITGESDAAVTLRQALGEEISIPREAIKTMESTSLSMMPEELEKNMTRQEMRDLIGFLKGGAP